MYRILSPSAWGREISLEWFLFLVFSLHSAVSSEAPCAAGARLVLHPDRGACSGVHLLRVLTAGLQMLLSPALPQILPRQGRHCRRPAGVSGQDPSGHRARPCLPEEGWSPSHAAIPSFGGREMQ